MAKPLKSISAKNFINRLKNGQNVQRSLSIHDNVIIEGLHFRYQVKLSEIFIDGDFIVKNCRFDHGFWFSEIEIDGNLEIHDSTIEGYLNKSKDKKKTTLAELRVHYEFTILNVATTDIIYLMESHLAALYVTNSKLQGGLSLYSNSVDDEVSIENSTLEVLRAEKNKVGDCFEIKHLQSDHIHFVDNQIKQNLTFEQINVINKFYFERDTARYFRLDRVKTQNLWLDTAHIGTDLDFRNLTAEDIWLHNLAVSGDTNIIGISTQREMQIKAGHYHGDVFISEIQAEELNIDGTSNEGHFIIQLDPKEERTTDLEHDRIGLVKIGNGTYGKGMLLNLHTFMLPKLHLMSSKSFEGLIGILGGIMEEILVSGINNAGVLNLQNCLVNALHIEQVLNSGNITFSQIIPVNDNSQLNIERSSLGHASFVNMDMSRFTEVQIHNSLLEDIKYSNVQWFHPNVLNRQYYDKPFNELSEAQRQGHLGNKREVYRQLKYAAEKQGDRAQSLKFKAEEFTAYQDLLQYNIDSIQRAPHQTHSNKKEVWQLRAENWSLQLGLYTNSLGQNWLRPLAQILIITLVFFPFYIIAASPTLTWWPFGNQLAVSEALNLFWEQRGVLPQLFNPTRYLSRVFGTENLPGDIYFIDTLHRIILAFYIYQIISAFRKYFK